MGIEIEVRNGDESWPLAESIFTTVWPPDLLEKLPWGHVQWAHADLRVLIEAVDGDPACHVGIYFRTVTWNGRKIHVGGIGGVATRPDCRRRGYGSLALNAAAQTMRDQDAAQFALLFCEPHNFEFYLSRGWQSFAGDIYAEQPGGRIRFELMSPFVFDLKRPAPRRGTIDLCGLPW
jgi:aminoglycoside 2'-N-acetyltransferase I